MRIEVLSGGLLTMVQDTGRGGHAAQGVGTAGAVDAYSHAVANLLVGNRPDCATLEITLAGPRLRLHAAARIALCGADIAAEADGVALPGWRPVDLPAGCELSLGACRHGCRAYLAVAGGIPVPAVMGSRATDLRGGFGGLEGRALKAGDRLGEPGPVAAQRDDRPPRIASWWIDPQPDIDFAQPPRVGVLPGHRDTAPPGALFDGSWTVSKVSDRQGLRLEGRTLAVEAHSLPSEPVVPGTIQLPPDGQPIVLLADAQTVGGYPRIGHVARAHLPRLAQLRPGDRVALRPVSLDEALAELAAQQHRLARMRLAIEAHAAR